MIGKYIRGALKNVSGYAETALNETNIRVAVTGLSQAGKTVFLTSLIHNLLALGQRRDTLPALRKHFEAAGASRLHSVRVCQAGTGSLPCFDYDAKLAALASGTSAWPARTDGLAQITLEIEIDRIGPFAQRLGRRRVRLELFDYPGEWLLDLPLLSQTYREWSEQTMLHLRRPSCQAICAPFLEFLSTIGPDTPADEVLVQRGVSLYRDVLQGCRRLGFRYLQPGRLLCPGPQGEAPMSWFCPLRAMPKRPTRASLGDLMNDRFEAYQANIRKEFFDTHFGDFERQVFLIDLLSALYAGKDVFEDIERAVADIGRHLKYGANWLTGPVGRVARDALRYVPGSGRATEARVERVAFVATKADHVPSMRREHLRNLLRAIAETASDEAMIGRPISYHTVASVLATTDGTARVGERAVEVVVGLPLGEERQRPFYPGEVPSGRPPNGFWSDRFFELPIFAPPRIDPSGVTGIPHLGLDELLVTLLKDVL